MDPAPREARARLDDLMEQRRLELGLSWRDVALRAGVAYETVRAARAGDGGISPLTASGLERALGWQAGSVKRILDGGDPELAATPSPGAEPRFADPRLQWIMDTPGADLEWRLAVVAVAQAIFAQREGRGDRSA